MTRVVLQEAGWDWVDGYPFGPPDPLYVVEDEPPAPGFSMTGGDVFVLGAIVVAAWGAVIALAFALRRIWR